MKKIILSAGLLCILFSLQVTGQTRTITGTVTDVADGTTLPGVTILEKGTANGTITNADGNYSLTVQDNSKKLIFSYIGMLTLEKEIPESQILDIEMESTALGLDEVVVIGYGAVKKSDITGSVASVEMEKLKEIPANSFDEKMQGRIAGVQITKLSGQPGGATSIRIRGGNSIMAGNEPLYVIDGVIVESQKNFSWIGSPAENGLSSINPNDIESIEVLKDASATAIYGARGANGVVIITTKSGKRDQDQVTFNAYVGLQQKTTNVEVMNAAQFATLYDEAGYNADPEGYVPKYPNPDSLGSGTDWQNEIYRDAPIQNYSLMFTGGNEKTTYAIGGDFFRQDGIIQGSDFQRISFRLNLDRQVSKKISIGTNLTLTHTDANTVSTDTPGGFFPGVVNTALTFSPILPVYDEEGNYTLTDPNADAWLDNPVAVTRIVDAKSNVNRILGNAWLEWKIIPELKFYTSLGIDYYRQIQDMYTPRTVYSGSWNNGQARFVSSDLSTYIFENTLTWDRTFNEIHRINMVGGFTFQETNARSYIDISTSFPNDILSYYGIENAENIPNIYASFGESAIASFLGRINYTLSDKYLFTFTGRYDGSSRFGSNNRYAFFPSGAFAWRIIEEGFMESQNVFSDLKLRISYGLSGNDRITDYAYIRTIANTSYYFNKILASGFAPDNPGNNNLKWETTKQFNAGIDMAFFNSRLVVTSDYYHKTTEDLLFFADLPWTSGYDSYTKNVGSLENSGFEFALSSDNLVGAFKWNSDFNISFNKNRIINLEGQELFVNNDTYKLKIGNWAVIREGEQMGSFWGYESDGIWQLDEVEQAAIYDAEPGDFKYIDQNSDGVIDADDRKIIGNALPDFYWGFNNGFSFKNFRLDVFFQGVHGYQILNSNRFELESGNGLSNASVDMLNRWTPDNPSNIYPRANRNAEYLYMSDRYLEDGSYVRLKVITLSYDLPLKTVARIKMKGIRVYLTAENLATFTKYTGFDPEVSHFGYDNTRLGYDYGGYPASRTFIFGVNLTF